MHENAPEAAGASAVPFTREQVARLPYLLGTGDWDAVLDRLETLGWEAAVHGPRGSGKSVFLDGLAPALEADGFRPWRVRFDPDRRNPLGLGLPRFGRGVQPDVVLLVDGADGIGILGRLRLRRLGHRLAGLVVASREPHPGLPTLHETRASARRLEDLVRTLAPWGPRPSPAALRRIYLRHGGDVGAALRSMIAD